PQGPVHMDGHQALAFARNRHIPSGDVQRTEDQAQLMLATLAKLRPQQPAGAASLKNLAILLRHARAPGVSLRDLYRFGRLGLSFDPATIRTVTVPTVAGKVGAAEVLFTAPAAGGLFQDFRDDAVLEGH